MSAQYGVTCVFDDPWRHVAQETRLPTVVPDICGAHWVSPFWRLQF
jgi:hypothetical protein